MAIILGGLIMWIVTAFVLAPMFVTVLCLITNMAKCVHIKETKENL